MNNSSYIIKNGYVQEVNNSHFFTSLDQIVASLEVLPFVLDKHERLAYILTALKNTREKGYQLIKEEK